MRGYLVDPHAQSVTAVDWEGTLEGAYRLVRARPIDLVVVDARGTTLVVDDEGLLRGGEQAFFGWRGPNACGSLLAGRALVTGSTPDGDWADCRLGRSEVASAVRWVSPLAACVWLQARGLL